VRAYTPTQGPDSDVKIVATEDSGVFLANFPGWGCRTAGESSDHSVWFESAGPARDDKRDDGQITT